MKGYGIPQGDAWQTRSANTRRLKYSAQFASIVLPAQVASKERGDDIEGFARLGQLRRPDETVPQPVPHAKLRFNAGLEKLQMEIRRMTEEEIAACRDE